MRNFRHRDCLVGLVVAALLSACGAETAPDGRRPGAGAAGSGWASNPQGLAGRSGQPGFAGQSGPGLAGTGSVPVQPPPTSMKPDSICEIVRLTAAPQTPDMMIVLDRSGSMTDGGRWQPSVAAVRSVTTELEARIRFGLAMFPDPKATNVNQTVTNVLDCFNQADIQKCIDEFEMLANTNVCAPGDIVVPVAEMNAMAIGTALSSTQPSGGTPTSETLQKLVTSFANQTMGPDDMGVHAKYVLLVTDGQPTCPAGRGQDTTPADIDASNKAIEALLAKDVRTYVIGYDTTSAGNEALASVLDGFAMRGGTGQTKHTPVEDEASLLMALQGITGQIVGCSFTLDKPPSRADFVLVKLNGQQVNLDDPDGWKLVGDRTIELTGKACETFRSPGSHTIDAEVQCSVVGPA